MRLILEQPDPPRLEPLLESLAKQYQEVMDQLLQLQREDRVSPILRAIQQQQDGLIQAFERMMLSMHQGTQDDREATHQMLREEVAAPQQQANDALLTAIRGLRRSVSGLPDNLGTVMDKQLKSRQQQIMKEPSKTRAPVESSNRIVQKLDEMEQALVQATRRSRSRTFGSNY